MKTKFVLFLLLALFSLQGWATPVDSLRYRPFDPNTGGVNSGTDELVDITRIHGLTDVAGVVNPNDIIPNALSDVISTVYPVLRTVTTDGTDYFKWKNKPGRGGEYVYFSFNRQRPEALLGVDTVLYLTAHQGFITSPLTVEMLDDDDGVFDFHEDIIYPELLIPMDTLEEIWHWGESVWCGKRMKVGFHPSGPGDYSAMFLIKNASDIKLKVTLTIKVVEAPENHKIYVSRTDMSFYSRDGDSDTDFFTLTATNMTDTIKVEIIPYLEYDISYGEDSEDLVEDHTHLFDRLLFNMEGSIREPGLWGDDASELLFISPEEAANGAIITIHYTPTWPGYHQAKIRITGDGLTKYIILHGNSHNSTVTVSNDILTFPYEPDSSDPSAFIDGVWKRHVIVTGDDLIEPLVMQLVDDEGSPNDKDMFSIEWNSDTIDIETAENGALVPVKYNPTESGVHKAKIIISVGPKVKATVHLRGTTEETEIIVSPTSLTFTDAAVGEETAPQTLMVRGKYLTSGLTLDPPETTGANGTFKLDRYTISAEEANEAYRHGQSIPVKVTFIPTEVGHTSGRIIIHGGGANTVTVPLDGYAVPAPPTVTPSSLTFGPVTLGEYDTDNFTVFGEFTSNLQMTVTPDNGVFSINKTEISPEHAARGQIITVTYRPVAEGTQTATVTITGGGAPGSKTVKLTGTAIVREIKAEPAALTFSKQTVGVPISKPFIVTATNPNAELSLKLNDNTGMFSFKGSNSNTMTISTAEAANGAEVNVTYKPTAIGSHVASITITGGGALEEKIVMLNGSAVNRDITTTPSEWDFGNVALNVPKSRNIIIKADNLTSDLTLELSQRPNLGMYSISKTTITAAEAASGKTVTIYYTPTAVGSHNASIKISGGDAPTKYVSITGTGVIPAITTSETQLNFGKVVKNKTKSKTFIVTGANLTSNLTLSSNNSYFTVTPSSVSKEDAALGVLVTVTYKPTATGNHSGAITLSSEGVSAAVNVSGTCVIPTISVSKTSLDFGNMDAGSTKTLSFTVTGTDLTGDISLTVASTDSHADFTITPTTLGANASGATVKVTCTANVAGSISGRVTVSGGDATSKTVNLTGTVKCYIKTNHSSLSYSPSSLNKSVKVTCVGANSKLSLALTGDDASYFRLGTSSISMADARDGKTVSVACVPKTKDRLSAQIKISGGGADDPKYVTLSYSNGVVSINSVQPDGENKESNEDFTNGGLLDTMGSSTTDVNELAMNSKIYAEGQNIIIKSPVEQSVVISDIAGRAWSVKLKAGLNEIPVNASGVYLVRIREKTTKLILK